MFFFQNRDESKMQDLLKEVKISLMYFGAIITNNRMEQFSGSASQVLEAVTTLLDQLPRLCYAPEQRC